LASPPEASPSIWKVELEQWRRWYKARGRLELRAILLTDWDPLQVGDAAQAQDEYDDYVGVLGRLLWEGASTEAVADYLASCEQESGFLTRADQLTDVATRISSWYASAVADGLSA
jgi:hypothetical protein